MSPPGLEVGILLPSFSSISDGNRAPAVLRDCAQQAESLGFDSAWVIDHFLRAPVYGQSWLDPLLTLAYVAGQAAQLKLGTAVLLASLRNPVLLAKEVATLQALSGGRFILGLGTGWNPIEFEALQVPRQQRGERTDEAIEILRLLLSQESAAFEGRHFRFPEIAIEPLSAQPTPIWIGGGSQPRLKGATESGQIAPDRVIERIAHSDGWCAPPHSGPELLRADWARIQSAALRLGRNPAAIVFSQQGYFHIVDTEDRETALAEQRRVFGAYMGAARPWSFVQRCYLVGSVSDIVARLKARGKAGVRYLVLGPVTDDPATLQSQLDLLKNRVLAQL